MSLHHSHGDIEDARTSYILANADAADNVELFEHPSYKNSLQSNSGVTTRNRGRPPYGKGFMLLSGLASLTPSLTGGRESY